MLRTTAHSHSINIWHRRLAHLNHQDLTRLLESSGERFTDMDVESVTDPTDVELVMDRMDTSPCWETPGLCRTCVHAKQQQHIVRTKAPGPERRLHLCTQICAGL